MVNYQVLNGTIEKPIARKPDSIIERCISANGKHAVTHFEVIKKYNSFTLVKCILETGRTHQIRVHFSSIGHPLLGDSLYYQRSPLINRQALHAYQLKLIHPITKEKKETTILLKNKKHNKVRLGNEYFCLN